MAPNLTVGTSVFLLEERIKEDKSAVPLINGSTILRGGKFKVQEKEQPETDYKPPTTGIEGYLQFKTKLIWLNIISIFAIHFLWIYCFATVFFRVKFLTFIFHILVSSVAGFGITAGAHRYWTHKAFKANLPLRIILLLSYCVAGENRLVEWIKDHRVHHKYSETDADPHNSNRGFFFAHVGWLMMRKHPEVLKKGRNMDFSDIYADPVVQFGEKYWVILKTFLCFVIPSLIPIYCWNEDVYRAIMANVVLRYVWTLNSTWMVNSAAHMWGVRPYDKNIRPVETKLVSFFAMGEGFHNYHHVFPWDYKAAELGDYGLNWTTAILDQFAKIGWAWDMKQPSAELVKATVERRGDGTHQHYEVAPPQDD